MTKVSFVILLAIIFSCAIYAHFWLFSQMVNNGYYPSKGIHPTQWNDGE